MGDDNKNYICALGECSREIPREGWSFGITNSEGQIEFEVNNTTKHLFVVDEQENPIKHARVDIIEQGISLGFYVYHPDFSPRLKIVDKVSPARATHLATKIVMNKDDITVDPYPQEDASIAAYNDFSTFVGNPDFYIRCVQRDEMELRREVGTALIKYTLGDAGGSLGSSINKVFGITTTVAEVLQENGQLSDPFETYCAYGQQYTYIPNDIVTVATTVFVCTPRQVEMRGNRIDDDCDGTVDNCRRMLNELACIGDSVYRLNACGEANEHIVDCAADQYCEEGQCHCYQHAGTECSEYDTSAIVSYDSCGNIEDVVEYCEGEERCVQETELSANCVIESPDMDECEEIRTYCVGSSVVSESRCGIEVVERCDYPEEECFAGECVPCEPQASTTCHNGDVYFVNSCGRIGDVSLLCTDVEECIAAECVNPCEENVGTVCVGSRVFSTDSCGNVEGLVEWCDASIEMCIDGSCTPCTPDVGTICEGYEVYTVDSCGNVGSFVERCTYREEQCVDGTCVPCEPRMLTTCFNDDAYWMDSCGNRSEELSDDCGDREECADGECVPCEPNSRTICSGNDVLSVDSCNNIEGVIMSCDYPTEECESGDCVPLCWSHTSTECYDGHAYWVNSCGDREEVYDICFADRNEVCSRGLCVDTTLCDQYGNDSYSRPWGTVTSSGECCKVEGTATSCLTEIIEVGDFEYSTHPPMSGTSTTFEDLTFDGTAFWATVHYTRNVVRIDMEGNIVSSFEVPSEDHSIGGITWDGSYLWVIDQYRSSVLPHYLRKITRSGETIQTCEVNNPSGVAWDESGSLLYGSVVPSPPGMSDTTNIHRITSECVDEIIGHGITTTSGSTGIAFDGTFLYQNRVNGPGGEIVKYNLPGSSDGYTTIASTAHLRESSLGLAKNGSIFYVTDQSDDGTNRIIGVRIEFVP